MTLVSHSGQKSNLYETVHVCETAPSSSEQFSPGCLWGRNSLTPTATPNKQGLNIYWLTCTLPWTSHKLTAHIRPCAHSLLMTSRRAILGNHSYRFSTSPILTPFHLYHWPDLLQLSHTTDAVFLPNHSRIHMIQIQSPWRLRQYISPKCQKTCLLHDT
jgi:hypothetical protein